MPRKSRQHIDNLRLSKASQYPIVNFAVTALLYATEEALEGDVESAIWLFSDQARFYSWLIGSSHKNFENVVRDRFSV